MKPTKICTTCQQEKPLDDYPPDARSKDGKQSKCRKCINAWMREHYHKDPVWSMLRRAKARAAKEGFDFNLEAADISPLPAICPVLGYQLRISVTAQDTHAYSLDRIDNTKGYVRGNVAVMSYKANRLKNDGTAEEHEAIAAWMRAQAANDITAVTSAAERVTVVV